MNKVIEEIRGRYKDKHQQYNSPIKMWDDMQVTLSHISILEEKVKEDHKFYKLVNDRAIAAEVKRDELDSINTGLSEALAAALDDFSKAESRIKEITEKWESVKFKVFDTEQKVKELEEAIKTTEIYTIDELKEKTKELQEERDGYKNGQIQLQGMVDDLMDVNAKWAEKVKELMAKLNTETYIKEATYEALGQAESRLKRLEEAVDKYRKSPKFTVTGEHGGESCRIGNWKADDELYKTRDEK